MDEAKEDVIKSMYSICVTNDPSGVFMEHTMKANYDDMEGDNELGKRLRQFGMTLSQLLSTSRDFVPAGPQKWRIRVNANATGVLNTLADNKKGSGSKKGRGGSAASRGGRGGPPPRVYSNPGLYRGNSTARGRNASGYGSTFRQQPPPAYIPPTDFSNQRPLMPRDPAPSNDSFRREPDYGGNGGNGYHDKPRYDRSRSPYRDPSPRRDQPRRDYTPPPPRRQTPPPPRRQTPPPRDNRRDDYERRDPYDDRNRQDDRGYNDRRYDDRNYNDRRNDGYDDRNYGNRYDEPRRSSPDRRRYSPDRRGYSPQRRDFSPDRRRYSPRRPSPPPPQQRDPRSSYAYNEPRRRDSPPPPQPRVEPSRIASALDSPRRRDSPAPRHQNEYPPRPDSQLSEFSQHTESSDEEDPAAPVNRYDERMPKSTPVGLDLGDLAKRFQSKKESKEDEADRRIAQALREFMINDKSESAILLEDLLAMLNNKRITIPGRSTGDKEEFISDLKQRFPDVLDRFYIDTEESHYRWIHDDTVRLPPARLTGDTAEKSDMVEDELHFAIIHYLETMIEKEFEKETVIDELMKLNKTDDYRRVSNKLTYILFYKLKTHYVRAPGPHGVERFRKVNINTVAPTVSHVFNAGYVHKLVMNRKNVLLEVRLTRFLSFSKFAVRVIECDAEFEEMEREIKYAVIADLDKPYPKIPNVPEGGWRPGYACICRTMENNLPDKWSRGVIVRKEADYFRVHLLDVGHVMLLSPNDMKTMPPKYRVIPAFAIMCCLNTDEEYRDYAMNEFGKAFRDNLPIVKIQIPDGSFSIDNVFSVDVLRLTRTGDLKNILDEV